MYDKSSYLAFEHSLGASILSTALHVLLPYRRAPWTEIAPYAYDAVLDGKRNGLCMKHLNDALPALGTLCWRERQAVLLKPLDTFIRTRMIEPFPIPRRSRWLRTAEI